MSGFELFVVSPRFSSSAILWADAASRAAARNVGLIVAGVVLAFAIWQFREQFDRVKRPNVWFDERSERDFKFLKRQAFRRLQLSGLAGVAGGLMLIGLYLPPSRSPLVWTFVWLGVVFFVGWTALLAGVDAVSIWLHFASAGRRRNAEKILLEYRLRQMSEKNATAANDGESNDDNSNDGESNDGKSNDDNSNDDNSNDGERAANGVKSSGTKSNDGGRATNGAKSNGGNNAANGAKK